MSLELVRTDDEWQRRVDEFARLPGFEDATIPALADAVWLLNLQIHKLRSRRDHLQQIVLDHCITGVSVTGPKTGKTCYAQDYLADVKPNGEPVWKWKLEWSR